MPTHTDVLNNMPSIRAAMIRRYKWFIHTTPEQYIGGIRERGLQPNRDATAPAGERIPILTLHPLGAKICPRPAYSTWTQPWDAPDPKLVSLAVDADDLPHRLDIDWSYEWPSVEGRLQRNENQMKLEELVVHLVNEYGSLASREAIDAGKLRIFCKGNPPANPGGWTPLCRANDEDIVRHD